MDPLLAGSIGAAITLAVVIFGYLVWRGLKGLRELRLLQRAPRATREVAEILTAVPSGAVLVGPHDEILMVNEAGAALGLALEGRLGFSELLDQVRRVRVEGEPFRGELERAEGDVPDLLVSIVALRDDSVLVLGVDQSGRKRAEAMRRDFLANVSHELKTPIGAIGVLGEALEAASDSPAAVREFSVRLQREATRLGRLVTQIIGLSRLESADPQLAKEPVRVAEFVDEALGRAEERAASRGVSLICAPLPAVEVLGDRWQLADAVTNLVVNAVNYSDERARVVLSGQEVLAAGQTWIDIKVIDNGIGIKLEEQERIFERFYRVDYARSREQGGSGLGLAMVRHIALAHGGSVSVWSRPGQGSTFTLRLPVRESEE